MRVRLAIFLAALALIAAACNPVDTSQISLEGERTSSAVGFTWEFDFYRNAAYDCGLSGNYTFMVMNPFDDPDAEAPMWVYLHGGGVGYFADEGGYVGVRNQTQDTWNHEETFDDLYDTQLIRRVFPDNVVVDNTLKRRIEEGYRIVFVSMCDHDLYSGLSTPYPNNPNPGAEVNGAHATMAAVEFATENYPTTHVFAHGTSAGSIGVHTLAQNQADIGKPLTGGIADSYVITPRLLPVFDVYAGTAGHPMPANFDPAQVTEKIGYFADENIDSYPGATVGLDDFRATPILWTGGDRDPFCAGAKPAIAEAAAAGLNNCDYVFDGIRQAVANQPSSPHQVSIIDGAGHVPTNRAGAVNDIVDTFIDGVLATNPPPFGS